MYRAAKIRIVQRGCFDKFALLYGNFLPARFKWKTIIGFWKFSFGEIF